MTTQPAMMPQPKLYIVMRRDLWSMNPGKGMAQAAHAQADFDAYAAAEEAMVRQGETSDLSFVDAVDTWRENRTFGVTLVLHAPLEQMQEIQRNVAHSGMTVDPTYPYHNWYGELFVREEVTCMWVFVWEPAELEYMKGFDLHG